MKHILFRAAFACFVVAVSLTAATAQTTGTPTRAPQVAPAATAAAPTTASRTTADEDFELNITERRITKHDFEAATDVEAVGDDARGVALRVGVALRAQDIDVLLRNVRGHVRFRASLEPLLSRLRRVATSATAPLNGSSSP